MATATEINQIIQLYVGYYNRAPDPIGLNFWIDAFDRGTDLVAQANFFSDQDETRANYPFFDSAGATSGATRAEIETFVDDVFANLFNRPPDAAGRTFWTDVIEAGTLTPGVMILEIIKGAVTSPDTDVIANKTAAGLDFYTDLSTIPLFPFTPADVQSATDVQGAVTADAASVTTAAGLTDTYLASVTPAPAAPTIVNLGSGADNLTGTAGDEIYVGVIDVSGDTLTNTDAIVGGGGDDTLLVRVTSVSSNGTFEVRPNATGVETLEVSNVEVGGAYQIDTGFMTDLTTVRTKDDDASAITFYENVQTNAMVELDNVEGFVVVNFEGDRSSTDNDAINLSVSDSGTMAQAAFFRTADPSFGNDTGFEIMNLTSSGSTGSFLDAFGMALETLNVDGDQALKLMDTSANFAGLEAVDASAMTSGGLDIDASGNTEAVFSFMGSDANDRIVLSNTMVNASTGLSLDAAGGSMDTLAVTTFGGIDATKVNAQSGFEVLESTTATSSLDAGDFNDINTFLFSGQTSTTGRVIIREVETNDLFIFASDMGQNDETVRFESARVGQNLTMELEAQSGAGGNIEIVTNTNTNNTAAVGFANSFSAVEIVSSGDNDDANLIAARSTGGGNHYAFDNQGGPTNFTISGSQDLSIGVEGGVSLNASSNFRGFFESASVDGSAATGNLAIAGSGTDDAISGGSGNDILYGLGGEDELTGNAGTDQFRLSDWTNDTDTFRDFTAGEDKIALNENVTNFVNTTATQEGAVLSSSDYVENLTLVANLSAADTDKVVELQGAASQTQIADTTAGSATGDVYVLVYNSTSGNGELWFDSNWADTNNRDKVATLESVTDLASLVGITNTDFVEYIF